MSNTDPSQPNTGNKELDAIINDLKNPFASQVQTVSILVSLGISLGVMLAIVILFSVIRPHHKNVFQPKLKHADPKRAPPPLGNGFFAWLTPVIKTKEEDLIKTIGMDATLYLRFTRMLRNIFIFLTVIGCAILIPVHIIFTKDGPPPGDQFGKLYRREEEHKDGTEDLIASRLYWLTPRNVYGQPMWAHVVFAYISDFLVLYFLWSNYKVVVRLRKAYFESPDYQNSVHGRSLMVRDIRPEYRSDEGIFKIVDSVTEVPSIPKTAMARNMKELPELLEEHDRTVRKLEAVLAKYLKNPDKLPPNRPEIRARGRGKVDAIEYLTNRIRDLEVRIRDTRETIDKRNPEPYGFATYETINDAHTVAWQARKKKPKGAIITLAPSPKEIIWKNMRLSKAGRGRKRFMANVWVALLTTFYILPNALVAIFLADLSKLAAIWPSFNKSFQEHPTVWGVVQALLAPTIFSLFYLILPSIFRRISERSGDHTKTSRERHVTHKLYAFFVFNNLLVFSLFSSVWNFVSAIIDAARNKQDVGHEVIDQVNHVPGYFLTAVCSVSSFWVVWLLQRNIGAAVDLAQLWNMTVQRFKRAFMAPTPREMIELSAPPPFDYAAYYNYFLYYATVGNVFATIQPMVLPITLLYFAIDAVLKKYLMMYVYITKTESGGQFWNVLHNRMLFSLLLQNIIGALVILGAMGTWLMIFVMAPLPFILLAFKIWIGRTYANQARFYTRGLQSSRTDMETFEDSKKMVKAVSSRLLNPVMTKKLITPMVHARSKHLLAELYHGRMDDVDGQYNGEAGYGDIPMGNMDKQKQKDVTSMFETVQEHELDFEHFKNRAEFREEFGGSGELYGRPLDTMTERSGTPASFMTRDESDDGMSQYPAPHYMSGGGVHPAFRQAPQGSYGVNPAQGYDTGAHHYAGGSYDGQAGGFPPPRPNYTRNASGGSDLNLVAGAQPMGYAAGGSHDGIPGYEFSERETFGLNRWRNSAAGYSPIQADTNYDAYRRGQPHR